MRYFWGLSVLWLAAALLSSAQSVASQTPSGADAWGDPVDGVQLHLAQTDNSPFRRPGELPSLEIQIRNGSETPATYSFAVGQVCDIEIDGKWYIPGPSGGNDAPQPTLMPGAQSEIIRLSFQSFNVNGKVVSLKELNLKAGKHSVRVRTPTAGISGIENPAHRVIRLVSNEITIETSTATF